MKRPAYLTTTYLIFTLLLLHLHGSEAIFSSLASLARGAVGGITNAVGLTPSSKITLSEDPKIALKQISSIMKENKIEECQIDLDKALSAEEATKIYNQAEKEINEKLPRRSVSLV